jgi:hypothetical protein
MRAASGLLVRTLLSRNTYPFALAHTKHATTHQNDMYTPVTEAKPSRCRAWSKARGIGNSPRGIRREASRSNHPSPARQYSRLSRFATREPGETVQVVWHARRRKSCYRHLRARMRIDGASQRCCTSNANRCLHRDARCHYPPQLYRWRLCQCAQRRRRSNMARHPPRSRLFARHHPTVFNLCPPRATRR